MLRIRAAVPTYFGRRLDFTELASIVQTRRFVSLNVTAILISGKGTNETSVRSYADALDTRIDKLRPGLERPQSL